MALKNNSGITLIELLIALAIISIAGVMLSQYIIRSRATAQKVAAIHESSQRLTDLAQKIRRFNTVRDSAQAPTITAGSIRFAVPPDSTSPSAYTVLISSQCRSLGSGQAWQLESGAAGADCLAQLACGQSAVPFVEIAYPNHPKSLPTVQIPSLENFKKQTGTVLNSSGYGLCITSEANSFTVKSLAVNLEKASGTIWKARTQVEVIALPIAKRNEIDIVP